jgi:hypothetical protein
MNPLIENPPHRVQTSSRRAFQFSLSQSSPAPLWQRARVQADGFHHGDLERTHWKKVWRSMFEQ